MTDKLPYPVQVHMPPSDDMGRIDSPIVPRLSGRDLDIVIPSDDARHTALGIFMASWGHLEQILIMIVSWLVGVQVGHGRTILLNMGMKQIVDSLNGLGLRKLPEEQAKQLVNLTERAMKLNTKRNIIVHGEWIFEANVIAKRGEACLVTQFLRCGYPNDPAIEHAMANPRNQKERVRYSFTIKRILGTARDVDTLIEDFAAFQKQHIAPVYPKRPEAPA